MNTYIKKFSNKKIIITGHTGFKGSWLTLILTLFKANVVGVSKDVVGKKSLYGLCKINKICKDFRCDIRNLDNIKKIILDEKPDYIFHLAAQSLVSESISNPISTFETNTLGTANILESVRFLKKKCSVVIVTSDKCYKNNEWKRGYNENDVLGGDDPYSASKATAELVFNSYFQTYFIHKQNINLATARAGNVIGGGDFSKNRIVPDIINSWINKKKLIIRSPKSTRPWQHVFEPLRGYMDLALSLSSNKLKINGNNFNFGPIEKKDLNVEEVIKKISIHLGKIDYKTVPNKKFKESGLLKLNCRKAFKLIKWKPNIDYNQSIELTSEWYRAYNEKKNLLNFSINQIKNYFNIK